MDTARSYLEICAHVTNAEFRAADLLEAGLMNIQTRMENRGLADRQPELAALIEVYKDVDRRNSSKKIEGEKRKMRSENFLASIT